MSVFFANQKLSAWLLPGLLSALSALSAQLAHADAPPSQDFWNYLVEFGDAQGELFDPADYATITNIPAQSLRPEMQSLPKEEGSERVPVHADVPKRSAPATQESLP